MPQQQTAFENIVGKEEIARNEQFLLFPQCFLLNQKMVSPFVNIFDIISLFAAELEEPKIAAELEEPKIGIWATKKMNQISEVHEYVMVTLTLFIYFSIIFLS